jgi:hypothetical protein
VLLIIKAVLRTAEVAASAASLGRDAKDTAEPAESAKEEVSSDVVHLCA